MLFMVVEKWKDRDADAVLAEPQCGGAGPGLTGLARTPREPTSLDSDLEKFNRAALAAL